MRQDKYTRSAKGERCLVRIPTVCNHNPETTVLAHLNGGGMGMKRLSIHGAYACSDCHDVIDGRVLWLAADQVRMWHLEGVIRTQERMIEKGILTL